MNYLTKVTWRIRGNAHFYGGDCRRSNTARFYSKKPAMKKKKKEKEEEEEAFYVVRRGDAIGFYRSLDQCQPQKLTSSSICDSPVSVFKGQGLQNKARDYLASRGLQNALYAISASDFREELFGSLIPCSLQDLDSSNKRSLETVEEDEEEEEVGSLSQKHSKLTHPDLSSDCRSCVLQFDGASKGNPGNSGAGAVLLADDGTLICRLSEGCGKMTNNMAEYRALRLGLKSALDKGFDRISVHGDSKLVCMQVQGLWKAKHENLISLHKEVMELKNKFTSFKIVHVLRGCNSAADAAANKGVGLCDGEIVEETSP